MRRPVVALCLGGLAAGAGLVGAGWHGQEPPAAPLPATPFDLGGQAGARSVALTARGGAARDVVRSADPDTGGRRADEDGVAARPTFDRLHRLVVPSLGIDAPVDAAGVEPQGALVVPADPARVGQWTGGAPATAAAGTTLLAGHVDNDGRLGALHPLAGVRPGAQVITTDARGVASRWRVVALQVRPKDDVPAFPGSGPRRLVLVTCGGVVVDTAHGRGYADNVVVTAEPAP